MVTDIIASKNILQQEGYLNIIVFVTVVDTETGLAEDKKDERSRLTATVREIERFLSDGLVKVGINTEKRGNIDIMCYHIFSGEA